MKDNEYGFTVFSDFTKILEADNREEATQKLKDDLINGDFIDYLENTIIYHRGVLVSGLEPSNGKDIESNNDNGHNLWEKRIKEDTERICLESMKLRNQYDKKRSRLDGNIRNRLDVNIVVRDDGVIQVEFDGKIKFDPLPKLKEDDKCDEK